MPHELLQTKLYIPPTRPQLVPRPRLIERLNEGLRRKLTLISAPAGFGKTTLVSDWVRQSERPGAWLSLDENDNDPIRFWSYLIAALSSIQPNLGQAALALLHAPQAPSITVTLIPLLNEMTALPDPIALVLDDYHVIEAQPIHDALTFLLDHLPPQMHLVITTRADPPLPLSRLRGRGQLTELRQTDLRFTAEEAATFLNGVMRLNLSAADVAALEERTEGWITGLQLAALSLRGAGDISGFIASFTGSQRYILDYLTDEVLSQQPEAVQTFLRQTSILGRLSGPLCDAVARRANSQTLLESLEAANMFIVSLDNEQRWYRYHHLFADLLRHQLKRHRSDQIPELYRRASQWFEKNELVDEAINYALLAKDFDRAANLIEQTAETLFAQMLMRAEISTLLGWLRALPDELVQARFRLCLTLAWVLLLTARKPEDLQSVEDLLQTAEGQMPPDETEELTEAHGHLAALRSYLALTYNDYAGAIVLARQALSDLPKDNRFLRGAISFNLATACWLNGDVVAAGQAYGQAAKDSRAAGNFFVALEALNNLGTMEAEQGHLHRAVEYHWQAVQMARDSLGQPGGPPPFAGSSYLGLAEVLREWNQLAEADQALETGLDLTRQGDNLEGQMIGYIISARVRQAQGDGSGALGAIATARQLLRPGELPALTPWLAAVEARLWLAQGNLPAAVRWVQGCGLDLGDAEAAFHRFPGEYTTLARVFIAQEREGAQTAVLDLLARMLSAMKAKNRTGRVIEILALQALALQTHNKLSQALTLLEQALALAESEEYVRVFVDEGPPMAVLLTRLNASREGRRMKDYISKLLAAFGEMKDIHPSALIPQPLVEPLTERELELLRLIATGYANREIADELVIALGTVKKHISNIYGKLGVQSRTQAIAKGRDLGLL